MNGRVVPMLTALVGALAGALITLLVTMLTLFAPLRDMQGVAKTLVETQRGNTTLIAQLSRELGQMPESVRDHEARLRAIERTGRTP